MLVSLPQTVPDSQLPENESHRMPCAAFRETSSTFHTSGNPSPYTAALTIDTNAAAPKTARATAVASINAKAVHAAIVFGFIVSKRGVHA